VAFSADGKWALATGPDNSIPGNTYAVRGWDLEAGEPNPSQPRGYLCNRVVFSPDGRRYLAGGALQYTSVWDVDPLQRVRDFDVGPHVYCGAFSRNGRRVILGGATLHGEPWVRVWELETGETHLDKVYPGDVHCVALSPDGGRAFSASKTSVQLWDVTKGEGQTILSGVQVASADFSPDGKYLVTGTAVGTIRLLSADKGAEVRSFEDKHSSAVTCLAFSPDGKQVASGGADKAVRVWDVATGKELQPLGGHDEKVTAVAFSPDGRRILSGSADKTVRLWDPANGR
jgi:WD40 repeat protein